MQPIFPTVGIVGTGAMGRGIAQMAVQAGSQVLLFDLLPGAAEAARAALADTWQKLVVKNKLTPEMQAAYLARVSLASAVTGLAPCALVVEAIVEKLDVKQRLFAELEAVVRPDACLGRRLCAGYGVGARVLACVHVGRRLFGRGVSASPLCAAFLLFGGPSPLPLVFLPSSHPVTYAMQ